MNAEGLRERIGGEWRERADGWWVTLAPERLRSAAGLFVEAGARFSALVPCPDGTGALRLSWHWDVGGILLSVQSSFGPDTPVPSIADMCPAADWAERETRDYCAVTFEGRVSTPPLVLREGDAPGVLLRREGGHS